MQNLSLNQLLIVTLIIVILSGGKHASLTTDSDSLQLCHICYENRQGHSCANLRATDNVTSTDENTDMNLNLIIQVGNTTWLDLSMNFVSQIRFQTMGMIALQVNPICNLPKTFCYEKLSSPELDCKYFKAEYPEKLSSSEFAYNFTGNLQTLILSQNNLKNLSDALTSLHSLQYLDLSHNLIDELREDVFTFSTKIVTLKLNNNLIESLRKETFEPLRNLQSLDLSFNRLSGLNLDIFEYLTNLLVLRISDNYNFSREAATEEESSGFIFSTGQKFEKLEMAGTSLSKIPIVLTRSIRELDLSNNSLTSIHCGEMDSYPLLQRLILQNNLLKVVEEDSLGRLEYLIELNLHGNSLRITPQSLPLGLQTLNLGYNLLEAINKTDFIGLVHLKTLILRHNRIEFIEESVLSQTVNLELLDLSNNPIKMLTSMIFAGPKSLINLQLSNLRQLNCMGVLACNRTFPFTELERLEILNLESSSLLRQQLIADQSVLPTLRRLKELNLSNTNLTELNPDWLNHLRRLEILKVHENPLNCSRSVYWFKELLKNMKDYHLTTAKFEKSERKVGPTTQNYLNIQITINETGGIINEPMTALDSAIDGQLSPKCYTPIALRGKSILDLPDDKLIVQDKAYRQQTNMLKTTSVVRRTDEQRKDSNRGSNDFRSSDAKSSIMSVTEKTSNSDSKQMQDEENLAPLRDAKKYEIHDSLQKNESSNFDERSLNQGLLETDKIENSVNKSRSKIDGEESSSVQNTLVHTESPPVLPQPVNLLNKVDVSSSEEPDRLKPVSNSLQTNKDSIYDEVYYQNDAPEGSFGTNRVKTGYSKDKNGSTSVASATEQTGRLLNDSIRNVTLMESDKTRITKHEVKSINKTHIEISRLGQRNKQLNSSAKAGRVNGTKPAVPGVECGVKNNEQLLRNISATIVSPRNQSTNFQGSLKLSSSTGDVTDIEIHPTTRPLMMGPCDAVNATLSSTESMTSSSPTTTSLTFPQIETTTALYRQELNNSSKMKSGDTSKKGSSFNGTSKTNSSNRRKSVRKMKNVEMTTLETLRRSQKVQDEKTTAISSSDQTTTAYNAETATVNYETSSQKLDTSRVTSQNNLNQEKKTGGKLKTEKDRSNPSNDEKDETGTGQKKENKDSKDGQKSNKNGRKSEKKTKQIKLLETTTSYADRYDGANEEKENVENKESDAESERKSNTTEKNRNNDREKTTSVKRQEDIIQNVNTTMLNNMTTGSISGAKIENGKDKSFESSFKNNNNENENGHGINNDNTEKGIADHQEKRHDVNPKHDKNSFEKTEYTNRSNGEVGSKGTDSHLNLEPMHQALGGVTHNTSDKIQIYASNMMKAVDNKSDTNSKVNSNKYNSNLESVREDLGKGAGGSGNGSHPGMLIFLLVVSVLLFTLSLMLISHWTWCRQLNSMYELSADQQILGEAESDFEINSLTNFKDHERW